MRAVPRRRGNAGYRSEAGGGACAATIKLRHDRGELDRIDLRPDRRTLFAAECDLADAGYLGNLLGDKIICVIIDDIAQLAQFELQRGSQFVAAALIDQGLEWLRGSVFGV